MSSHDLLAQAIQSLEHGIVIYDRNLIVSHINEKVRTLLNVPVEKFDVGDPFEKLAQINAEQGGYGGVGSVAERVAARMAKARSFNAFREDQQLHSGEYVEVHGKPLPQEQGYLLTYTDITERVVAQNESAKSNQAKMEFLSSMSHELRTPMNSILGFGQLLADDPHDPLDQRKRRFVQQILDNRDHLLMLINQVLDLSKIELGVLPVDIEEVSIAAVVDDCIAMSRPMAQKMNLTLNVDPTVAAAPGCLACELYLRQALLNLISNAIKFNKTGGSVTIGVSTDQASTIQIDVIDSGSGIPENERPNLFQPFNRLGRENSAIQGSGVGLSIAKKTIELMGGEIGYKPRAETGSVFSITLPSASVP